MRFARNGSQPPSSFASANAPQAFRLTGGSDFRAAPFANVVLRHHNIAGFRGRTENPHLPLVGPRGDVAAFRRNRAAGSSPPLPSTESGRGHEAGAPADDQPTRSAPPIGASILGLPHSGQSHPPMETRASRLICLGTVLLAMPGAQIRVVVWREVSRSSIMDDLEHRSVTRMTAHRRAGSAQPVPRFTAAPKSAPSESVEAFLARGGQIELLKHGEARTSDEKGGCEKLRRSFRIRPG